jgi:hypothetical protein
LSGKVSLGVRGEKRLNTTALDNAAIGTGRKYHNYTKTSTVIKNSKSIHYVRSWSRILLEKLIVAQLVNKSPGRKLITCSKDRATGPYPGPK